MVDKWSVDLFRPLVEISIIISCGIKEQLLLIGDYSMWREERTKRVSPLRGD